MDLNKKLITALLALSLVSCNTHQTIPVSTPNIPVHSQHSHQELLTPSVNINVFFIQNQPTPTRTSESDTSEINWYTWPEGWNLAHSPYSEKNIQLLLVFFYADGCQLCKKMKNTIYMDDSIKRLVNNYFIPIEVNVNDYPQIARKYNIMGIPVILLLSRNGDVVKKIYYADPEELKCILESVLPNHNK